MVPRPDAAAVTVDGSIFCLFFPSYMGFYLSEVAFIYLSFYVCSQALRERGADSWRVRGGGWKGHAWNLLNKHLCPSCCLKRGHMTPPASQGGLPACPHMEWRTRPTATSSLQTPLETDFDGVSRIRSLLYSPESCIRRLTVAVNVGTHSGLRRLLPMSDFFL